MRNIIVVLLLCLPGFCLAQVKEQFQEQLHQDSISRDFERKLLALESMLGKGVDYLNVDSLKKEPGYSFLDKKFIDGHTVLVFDLTWDLKNVYNRLEDAGKINRLKALRLKGQLKISARGIANEIELPKKTNRTQSYNDFYLDVIKKLLNNNKQLLKADKLDFATYQSWEKEAHLPKPLDVQQYRESFILFLYRHYNLN